MAGPLDELIDAQRDLERADADRAAAMLRRDAAVRAASAAGVTYVKIREATGLMPQTISKAIRGR